LAQQVGSIHCHTNYNHQAWTVLSKCLEACASESSIVSITKGWLMPGKEIQWDELYRQMLGELVGHGFFL
jgi:hypothetical protein